MTYGLVKADKLPVSYR